MRCLSRCLLTVWKIVFSAVALALAGPAHGAEPKDKADWWTFKPASRPALPESAAAPAPKGSTNPIDRFVRARLVEFKLEPSPEADPVTLIRRLTYDLIGLPPTPEEVDAFTQSTLRDPESAIASLADRLLASPRYGERWARHWLDVVHFGETHGYDKDKLRPHAWPYRDYVIRSLNQDKPWSRFVQEQLAGDFLFADQPDGIVALGFIAAGPWDFVGHVELPESKTDGLIARYNDRDDMVMTTFSAFQSLTVHCARCHDHKFDPISQRDYYSLQAVFAGVDRANRPYDLDAQVAAKRRTLKSEMAEIDRRQLGLKSALAAQLNPEVAALDHRLKELDGQLASRGSTNLPKRSPSNGYHSGIEARPEQTKWVQIDLGRAYPLEDIRLVPARPTDFPDTPGFGFPARFKIELSTEPDFGQPSMLADHTREDFKNPGDTPVVFRAPAVAGTRPAEEGTPKHPRYIRITATRLWERTHDYVFALAELQAFAAGTNVAQGSTVTALDSIEAGRWARKHLVDGFSSRARLEEGPAGEAALARRHELETEIQRLTAERERVFVATASPAVRDLRANLAAESGRLAGLTNALAQLPEPSLVYAAANDFKPEGSFVPPQGMRAVHFLPRGDVKRPMDLMPPAGLPCIPGSAATFALATNHVEAARRAALAKWITEPGNLQTRRSIVNRVWQYHFGRGLVDTPNDFGHMGSLPTHPELLNWLAFWFRDQGESLKQLHRLIVTSATYRQISSESVFSEPVSSESVIRASPGAGGRRPGTPNKDSRMARSWARSVTRDADNRFYWHQNRTRLDAECIRDAMLAVSGQLDLTMGGPSDRQFFFKDDHSPVYDYTRFDVDSKEGRRRSIYRHIVRSVTDPFMDCLDAADPSQLVARRNTTLTALQALATLNNPFVLKQCEHLAARLEREAPDRPAQIERGCRLAWSRPPSPAEKKRLVAYAEQHGLVNVCRVLFNSTEFVFVD